MDLGIKDRLFIVTGATSGFGLAIAKKLMNEDAHIFINGRRKEIIKQIVETYPGQVNGIEGDITNPETIRAIMKNSENRFVDGIVINAGGPGTGKFTDIPMEQWDNSYRLLLRWKIEFLKKVLPVFEKQKYGRILFIESVSVKQPIENLILSNSLRMSVVGLAKSLSLEYANKGITINILAPGLHDTQALERVIKKRSEISQKTFDETKLQMVAEIPVKRLGNPDELASLAVWLLSPLAGYITGQTLSIDGGLVKYSFG